MTAPLPDVTYATVTFGPYLDTNKKPRFVGMQGWVKISTRVTHKATGAVLGELAVPITISPDGTASVRLPHTDQATLDPLNFTYTVRWQSGYGTSPVARTFRLPVARGASVKYDVLSPSSGPAAQPGVFEPAEPIVAVPVPAPAPPPATTTPPATHVQSGHHHHYQNTPAASWVIDHPLNSTCPHVVLIKNGQLVYSDVHYVSASRVTIVWPSPTTGEAHLIT